MIARRFVLITLATLASACSPEPAPPLPPAHSVLQTEVNGITRSYILDLPHAYDGRTKLPMVILLHGANDSAAYAEEAYHFVEKGEEKGFILVLPDALGEFHAWHGFDPDTPEAPNNDLAFLDLILAAVPVLAHHGVKAEFDDSKTVTVTGVPR